MKIEKIKGYFDDVKGYKLGNYYLMKVYTLGNYCNWIVCSKEYLDDITFTFKRDELYNKNLIECVNSCKDGKQRLIELNENK